MRTSSHACDVICIIFLLDVMLDTIGITGIHWYCSGLTTAVRTTGSSNSLDGDVSGTLCITFDNGKIQLSHGDDDNTAEIIDTGLSSVSFCRWTTKGNILAVVGTMGSTQPAVGASSKGDLSPKGGGPSTGTNIVKFFDAFGKLLRNIRIPGDNISAISWEGGDLRLSLAVDSYIYFANIRHSYMWAYFLNSVVYSYPKPDRREVIQQCLALPIA